MLKYEASSLTMSMLHCQRTNALAVYVCPLYTSTFQTALACSRVLEEKKRDFRGKAIPRPWHAHNQTWSAGIRFNLASQLRNVDVHAMNGAPVACPHTWPSNTCLLRIVSRFTMRTFNSAYFVKS